MNNLETMKLALEALETLNSGDTYKTHNAATALRQAIEQAQQAEPKCNPHPKAPHGFNRNASHSNERYTCECEGWDAYEAGYQEGLQKGFEMEQAQQAEPVAMKFKIYKPTVPDPMRQDINDALLPWVYDQSRGSGFVASMWVTPVATLPPPRQWVGLTRTELIRCGVLPFGLSYELYEAIEAKLKEKNNG